MSTVAKVAKWNERCGNVPVAAGTEQFYQTISNQLKRIAEELNEAAEAVNGKDLLELFDAGIDLDVVVSGLNYLIGGKYADGLQRVLDNNNLKYTKSKKKANSWLTFHTDNGVDAFVKETTVGSQTFYCVRRTEDGKILKYGNFPKVDLTDLLPELAVEVYLLAGNIDQVAGEVKEFSEKFGMAVILADKLPAESSEKVLMESVLEEAVGDVAFIYVVNGTFQGAEEFDVNGPGQPEADEHLTETFHTLEGGE